MLPDYYEFMNSVKLLSGKKALENIPFELSNLQAKKPLILTTQPLIDFGQLNVITQALQHAQIEMGPIFKEIPQDSSLEVVQEISELYRAHACDSIIAVGGGSVIDTAKGVNILVSKGGNDLHDYAGLEIIEGKLNPLIVVPSTAGTGSEATLVSVIADPSRHVKMEFISYNTLPDVAVLDPRMTETLPAALTASTGVDALTHAVEAFTGLQKNPISDMYALTAIEFVATYLKTAVKSGNDLEARLAMANASFLAGVAFSNSMVSVTHAIGHACGAVSNVAHGDAMAILLPHAMRLNLDVCDADYSRILLAFSGPDIYATTPKAERGAVCIQVIEAYIAELSELSGLPTKLSEVGVKKADFATIAQTAINDGAAIVNPIEVTLERVMDILEQAY